MEDSFLYCWRYKYSSESLTGLTVTRKLHGNGLVVLEMYDGSTKCASLLQGDSFPAD